MTLEAPNLDDRSFQDIVGEAVKMIPRFCPEWTDYNPSDPGMTLIELMAWLTEMIIYRLNRVPDKNYIKFLELMGVDLKPPQPARAWLVFRTVEGAKEDEMPVIPAGTTVSTQGSPGEGERVAFETSQSLNLTASRLTAVFSKYKELYTDHTPSVLVPDNKRDVPVFTGDSDQPHILYLGDSEVDPGGKYASLRLHLKRGQSLLGFNVQWQSWDGRRWISILPSTDTTAGLCQGGEIVFHHLPELHLKEIPGYGSFWLRACLVGATHGTASEIEQLTRSFQLKDEYGVTPSNTFLFTETVPFFPLDFTAVAYPFGKEPALNNALYVGSSLFARKNARIFIDIRMSESYSPPGIDYTKDLELHWEYFSGTGTWKTLGITAATGVRKSAFAFEDPTDAFTKSGKISFNCPPDIGPTELRAGEDHWIRVRLVKGNFGIDTIHPPQVRHFLVTYREEPVCFERYLTCNYFSYTDLTPAVSKNKPFAPFEFVPEESPALYLAFDSRPAGREQRIYFRIRGESDQPPHVSWEYNSEGGWKKLKLRGDGTADFSRAGAVEFITPADWVSSVVFQREGFWIRARRETGTRDGFDRAPLMRGVHLNAVEARQAVRAGDEVLGSSTGEPLQAFRFLHSPVLPGPRVLVWESADGVEEERWEPWQEVENFLYSTSGSRHYTFDLFTGTVTFGDGKRGRIPPMGNDNIKCEVYYTGGGAMGNVGADTLTVLEDAFDGVDSVSNPDPAAGGADVEPMEQAKLRGPWAVKHRFRAVSAEDFEKLALEASGEVAKAFCYTGETGVVKVLIVPRGEGQKPLPETLLVQKVKQYLDERRLVTTRVDVTGPVYRAISILAEVVPEARSIHGPWEIKAKIEEELKRFFHPLEGGPYNDGWRIGRNVFISEIFYLLESIDGVDYVKRVVLNGNPWLQVVNIEDMCFPDLKEINIEMIGE